MKSIKTQEMAIADSLQTDSQAEAAFKAMIFCIYVYDRMFNTNHLKNVKALYVTHKKESLVKLSFILNSDVRSLVRHRKKYILCYKICSYALKNIESIF